MTVEQKAELKAKELIQTFVKIIDGGSGGIFVKKETLMKAKQCARIVSYEMVNNETISDKSFDFWDDINSAINKL